MTTIAWDGRTVAADTLGVCDGDMHQNPFAKIIKQYDGRVIGFTGDGGMAPLWIAWVIDGADPFETPLTKLKRSQPDATISNGSVLVFQKDKLAIRYCHLHPFPVRWGAPEAFGSGAGYAIGAMDMGASAQQAIEVAMRRDVNTGGKITVIEL